MNKLTKAAVAGTVGVALLLGGAGTLATWNSSAAISGGTIVAGNLVVDSAATPAGVWTDQNNATVNLASYRIVPGDTLTYTKTVAVTATGDNLVATLALAPGSIAASSTDAADVALAGYLTKNAVITASGTGIAAAGGGSYTVTAGTAGVSQNVTVTVTIEFPKSATAGAENASKLGSVDLSGLAVNLTQN